LYKDRGKPPVDDEALAKAAVSGRKHRRRGAAMVTSEAFENLKPEWAALHRRIPGATGATHPDAFDDPDIDRAGTVWLSLRVDDKLVGVVVLNFEPAGARIANGPGHFGLLIREGTESTLAEGLLEWLWEDLTESLELNEEQLPSTTREAFFEAADRLGWEIEKAGLELSLTQRR
jgi:hypothetical protein